MSRNNIAQKTIDAKLNKKLLLFILSCIVISRLLIFFVYLFNAIANKSPITFDSFLDSVNQFDADFYYPDIVRNGYRYIPDFGARQPFNFFPMFPALMRAIYLIMPIRPEIIGLIANSIILFFTCLFSYKYILLTRSEHRYEIAYGSIFLLAFGPCSFLSIELMPENLFMLLLILCLYFLKTKKYIRMGIAGACLSASKLIGIFFILVILVSTITEYLQNEKNKSFKNFITYLFDKPTMILAIFLIPIGIMSFTLFLQVKFGDGFAYIHTQQYGWEHGYKGYFNVLFHATPANVFVTIASLAICVYLIVKKRYTEAVIPLLFYLIMGMTSLESILRYMFSSVTVMYGLLDIMYSLKLKKPFRYSAYSVLALLELILTFYLVNNTNFPLIV